MSGTDDEQNSHGAEPSPISRKKQNYYPEN